MHPVIPLLTDRLAALPAVRRVWLFGSRARGDHRFYSDIDIGVELDDPAIRFHAIEDWLEEDAPTLLDVDLVPLHSVSQQFLNRVHEEGILLYERVGH